MNLPSDTIIPFQGMHPIKLKTDRHTNKLYFCTFIMYNITIARNRNHPCPSANGKMKIGPPYSKIFSYLKG